MNPTQFFEPLRGQSLLYPGISEDDRGQCVQSVELWLKATGTNPPIYPSAADYYYRGIPGYHQVAAGEPIQEGDIIVWRNDFPPSGGNGHIDVADHDASFNNFTAYDSNWVPLVLERVLHTGNWNNYIAGYLRKDNQMNRNATFNNVNDLAVATNGVEAKTNPNFMNNVEDNLDAVIARFVNYPSSIEFRRRASDWENQKNRADAAEAQVVALKKQLANTGNATVVVNGVVYIPK